MKPGRGRRSSARKQSTRKKKYVFRTQRVCIGGNIVVKILDVETTATKILPREIIRIG
jgi:hypothetical protein